MPDPNESPDVSAVAPADAPQPDAGLPIHEPGPGPVAAPDPNSVAPASTTPPNLPAPTPAQPTFRPGLIGRLGAALAGLAADGIPGAIQGAIDPRAIAAERSAKHDVDQANIRFASGRAASAVAEAARDEQLVRALPDDLTQAHNEAALKQIQQMHQLGLPLLTVVNTDDGVSALNALQSVAASSTLKHTDPDGTVRPAVPHTVSILVGNRAYVFGTDQIAANPDALNKLRTAQGLPAIPADDYQRLTPDQRLQAVDQAARIFSEAWNPKAIDSQLATLDSARQVYAATTPAWNTDKQKTLAMYDQRIQQGKKASAFFDLRSRQQLAIRAAVQQSQASYNDSVKQDVTGWTPADGFYMTQKQLVGARAKFTNSAAYKTAQGAETSYQMANAAYADYKQNGGKLPTGAQSMLMLSQHLATTFGTVKGSRVTKDMIQEHLGARGISDAAQVAVQRATNGDQLSPAQWDAFHDLIGQARTQAWQSAVRSAHASGLPVTPDLQLPKDVVTVAQPTSNPSQSQPAPQQKNSTGDFFGQFGGKARQ